MTQLSLTFIFKMPLRYFLESCEYFISHLDLKTWKANFLHLALKWKWNHSSRNYWPSSRARNFKPCFEKWVESRKELFFVRDWKMKRNGNQCQNYIVGKERWPIWVLFMVKAFWWNWQKSIKQKNIKGYLFIYCIMSTIVIHGGEPDRDLVKLVSHAFKSILVRALTLQFLVSVVITTLLNQHCHGSLWGRSKP